MKKIISRRRLIDILSIAVLAGALAVLINLYLPIRTSVASFDEFPVGLTRIVECNADFDALETNTAREKLDQIRDWLLYTAISSAGLSAQDASQATFDLPTVRHSYLQPVARFEYGQVRSAYVGDGMVVALIPAGDEKAQTDNLARVVDEHRKNLGELPEEVVTLEYLINLDNAGDEHYAEVTRRETIDAKKLFTEQAGYYEKKITDLDGLKDFLSHVDMVTYANADGGLTLGGRKLQGEAYRGITVEDVAALWQSEKQVGIDTAKYDAMWKQLEDRWSTKTYSSPAELASLKSQMEREQAELNAKIAKDMREKGFSNGSGFSLDPTYDFPGLKKYFDKSLAPTIKRMLKDSEMSAFQQSVKSLLDRYNRYGSSSSYQSPEEKIRKASEALGGPHPDAGPMLDLFYELSQKKNEATYALEARNGLTMDDRVRLTLSYIREEFGFQAARYDGTLQGTEVGMILFYTDLLAKLWLSDRFHTTPSRQIDGFVSQLDIQVSPLYKQDIAEHSSTRLWFGKHDKGFQVADDGETLLLDHIATRVYAAGSDPLQPGKESEANIVAATFLKWWDSHYEEIARYEPQYQRLNEVMRWSILIGWLNDKGKGDALDFLTPVKVYHEHRFPEWARKQPDLRFKNWGDSCASNLKSMETEKYSGVCFYPHDYKDCKTEALPLLVSRNYVRFGEIGSYSGGVSLVGRGEVGARQALSAQTKISPLLRRANLDYSAVQQSSSALRTLEGASYRFSSASLERSVVSATAKEGARLRSIAGEVSGNPAIESTFSRGTSGLRVETQVGGARVGSLDISRSGNGFRIGYTSRELDHAQVIARQMSLAETPESVLANSARVESYVSLPDEGGYLIKFKGADKLVKLNKVEQGTVGPRVSARFGDARSSTHGYDVSWAQADNIPPGGNYTFKPGMGGSNNRILNEIGRREYKVLIDEISRDPGVVYEKLGQHLDDGVQKASDLLHNGNFDDALAHIDNLIVVHGPRPELRTLRALTRLSKRSPELSVRVEETLRAGGERNMTKLLDEVNARLAASSRDGDLMMLVDDGRRVSPVYKTSSPPDVSRVTPDAVNKRAILLVEDSPGLNNMDWHVNTIRSLEQAVDLNVGQLYKVSRMKIADFRPSMLEAPGLSVSGKAVGQPTRYIVYYPSSLRRNDCVKDKNKLNEDCEPEVYILSATSGKQ